MTKEVLNKLKNAYLLDIIKGEDLRASSAMVAYARFLNEQPLQYNFFPLYLNILESNNRYAIDALLKNYVPERYLQIIVVPNNYVIENIFRLFAKFLNKGMYEVVIRLFCGFLHEVYREPDAGIKYYIPTVSDVNNLSKFLYEEEDQEYPLNRVILDILSFISDLDTYTQKYESIIRVARQASRIRSDYFDNRRALVQSITEVILRKDASPQFGVVPDEYYIR